MVYKTVALLLAGELLEGLEDALEVWLHLLSQLGQLFPQFSRLHLLSELQGSLLHLVLVLLDVGLQHGPQLLHVLRHLASDGLQDGHQLGLGLLPVGSDLLLQAEDHRLQLGPDLLHVLTLLDQVVVHEGLQLVPVLIEVFLQHGSELLALGLDVLAQVLYVLVQLLADGVGGIHHLRAQRRDDLEEVLEVGMEVVDGLAQEDFVVFELGVVEVSEGLVCGLLQMICINLQCRLHMLQLRWGLVLQEPGLATCQEYGEGEGYEPWTLS